MVIADASPLIVLAKLQRLKLLADLYGKVLIGPVVQVETIEAGEAVRALGVEQLQYALDTGWLQTVLLTADERQLMQRLMEQSRLDQGEAEAIALARGRRLRLIADDKEARSVAVAVGVELVGTAGVLLQGYIQGHFALRELEAILRDLSQVLWLSPAVVAEVLRLAREAKQ